MRQPAVTGVASTTSMPVSRRTPSAMKKRHALLDADPAILHAAILDDLPDDLVRTLVFLPDAHFVAKRRLDQLARAVFLEPRTDVRHRPLAGMTTPNVRSLWPQRMPTK